jgi:catechol 2,3-dioxygenase-like lactoylglutathione lyase family enzyme
MPVDHGRPPTGIDGIHHVNLVTPRLAEMADFYVSILRLEAGERPPFRSTGAWLYAGGHPVIHLVEGAPGPRGFLPQIEHFALSARGLAEVETMLRARHVAYRAGTIPGLGWPILNLEDPDGNRIEIVFPEEGSAGAA